MQTKFKQLLIALSVLAVLVILPAAVKADPVSFTLDDTHTVAAGGSVTFFGTSEQRRAPDYFPQWHFILIRRRSTGLNYL